MSRRLIAAVVAAATPAFAAAQTNITLFGIADAGVAAVNRGGSTSNSIKVDSGFNSTSRWGMRGTEDLGGGLSTFFKLEGEITFDTGGGDGGGPLNFARGSYVGLQGGLGQVWLGRDYVSGYFAMQDFDINRYGLFGNLLTFLTGYQGGTANGITYGTVAGMATRVSNGIFYKTPNFGGSTIQIHVGLGERDIPPKTGGNNIGVGWLFSRGPWNASAWYHDRKIVAGTATTTTKEYGGGGGYNFGGFKVVAGFGVGDPDGPTKVRFGNVGVSAQVGGGEVIAQVIRLKESASQGTGTSFSLGYMYPLSKRTNLYSSIGTTRNNDTGGFVFRGAGISYSPDVLGADPRGVVVGIRHLF